MKDGSKHTRVQSAPRASGRAGVTRLAFGAAVLVALGGGVGCAPATPRLKPVPAANDGALNRPFSPPIHSEDEDPQADGVVRIVGGVSCTGTLIADDLVLTAHHCVSLHDARGHAVAEDVAPETLRIEIGGDDFPYAQAGVKALVTPECGYDQGNGDIAILVLSRKLVGVPIWLPRVDGPPKKGERADTAGFGRCDGSDTAIHRHGLGRFNPSEPNTPLMSVTSGLSSTQASICPGDSGGPVFDANSNAQHEIIGVISSSVMTHYGSKGSSYFTRVDVWPQLFSAAREIADGASPSELPPFRSCSQATPPVAH